MPEQVPVRNVRTGAVDHMQVPTADEAYVAALLREREGYAKYGKTERVEAVDAELARLGVTRESVHDGAEQAVTSPPERAAGGRARRTARR